MSLVRRNVRGSLFGNLRSNLMRQAARRVFERARNRQQPNQNRAQQRNATRAAGGDNPLTTQHDFKIDYRRRRRTRRLRRRLKRGRRFTRRVVNSYIRATQAPQHVAKLALFQRTCLINQSAYFGCLLHPGDGTFTGDNPQGDWREFFIEGSTENRRGWDDLANPVAGPLYPDISERSRAIRCQSAQMEFTIRNVGTNPALVNVYRIVCRRSWPFPGYPIEQLYEEGFRRAGRITEVTQPVEGANTVLGTAPPEGMWDPQMRPEQLTSTPFQSFYFTRHFTIYRRTKYQLAPGEEINLMLKSNRPKIVNMFKVRGNSFVAGLTHGYFVDFQGVPATLEDETFTESATLAVQKQVRYSLSPLPMKRQQTSFDTQDPNPLLFVPRPAVVVSKPEDEKSGPA